MNRIEAIRMPSKYVPEPHLVIAEDGMDVIAEHRLVATFPDGASSVVVLRVGRPYAHPKGDYACPVQAEGLRLWQGPIDIFGVGSWSALMIGLRFLRSMLAAESERGAVFRWEGDDHPVSIEELFVRGPSEEAGP